MDNGNKSISPLRGCDGGLFNYTDGYLEQCADQMAIGLTKREHFAAMAMQGLLVNVGRNEFHNGDKESLAKASIEHADALLAALEKQQ